MTAKQYIARIRNPHKKAYAVAYWRWLQLGALTDDEPSRGALTYMGAQAVRLQFLSIAA